MWGWFYNRSGCVWELLELGTGWVLTIPLVNNRVKIPMDRRIFGDNFFGNFAAGFFGEHFLDSWSYLSLSVTTNPNTHSASVSWSPYEAARQRRCSKKSCCLNVRNVPAVLVVFFTLRDKEAFLSGRWGVVVGAALTEDSQCLPSAFKILSEQLNVKNEWRAKPQHTHQSLSKAVAKRGETSQMWLQVPLCFPMSSNVQCTQLVKRWITQQLLPPSLNTVLLLLRLRQITSPPLARQPDRPRNLRHSSF